MTTTDISFDPALHADRESDALQVLDLVLYRQIGTFSALEIAQVAELLPSWIDRNIGAITNARADETRDWYFPVFTREAIPTHASARTSSSWSGIHHLAENQASATVHSLPPLPAVPPSWRISIIVASAGGLLLLMPPVYPISSLENGDEGRPCRACGSAGTPHAGECWMNSDDWGPTKSRLRYAEPKVPQEWKSLSVWNPLTKGWRELPEPGESRGSLKWRYDEVLIDMMVDERANSYTIVMTFRKSFCMCVYTSTSNTWAYHNQRPLGNREMAWKSHVCASVVVRGRLHYAFVEFRLDAPIHATICVFEINVETGEWEPWQQYALRVGVWRRLVGGEIGLFQQRDASDVLRYLGLVECMGDMYAVIPTRENEVIIPNNDNFAHADAVVAAHLSREEGSVATPVQFHILGLNKRDVTGVLRIRVPQDTSDIPLRRKTLRQKTSFAFFPFLNWFSCTGKGSVIWVACEDYLLQYDVVSGRSKTQIIPKLSLLDAEVSYKPSFHMKP